KLVDQAGQTMDEIVTSVKHVADIMSEITAASQEQSSGIEEVNHAIAQMDEITQQNAALVEQAAASAESMQEQSAKLSEAVAVFKLGAAGQQAALSNAAVARPVTKQAIAQKAPAPARTAIAPRTVKPAAGGSSDEWEEF
ncbi:hypothetical protein EGT07_27015, partial [Herbaspirillum sp. HC18]